MADKSQRTEPPSQRRREKARREGQYPSAKEFVSALQFLAFVALLSAGGAAWFAGFAQSARELFAGAVTGEWNAPRVTHLAWQLASRHGLPLALAGGAIVALTFAIRLTTTGFGFSLQKLAPDFKRLNPANKLRDLPRQNLSALLEAALLLPVLLGAAYLLARDRLDAFLWLPLGGAAAGAELVAGAVSDLLWKGAWVLLVFGAFDLLRQIQRHNQDLRMSRQELKEEHKESEGNPQMKARIRRLQRDRARRRMMQQIPTATAVVVNPTHYAVAIRYELDAMAAPLVVAKGKNYLALRIRQKAATHSIPIIENPPLAQALYKSVDVGQEIPPHLYRAVAEILAYIFKLMHGARG